MKVSKGTVSMLKSARVRLESVRKRRRKRRIIAANLVLVTKLCPPPCFAAKKIDLKKRAPCP